MAAGTRASAVRTITIEPPIVSFGVPASAGKALAATLAAWWAASGMD